MLRLDELLGFVDVCSIGLYSAFSDLSGSQMKFELLRFIFESFNSLNPVSHSLKRILALDNASLYADFTSLLYAASLHSAE